ncbi:MAG: hypothetical protein JXR39_08750 [Marinilabiliaceae bacterium]|nr:hypothetical protein [Marinilabiliaceae bacterium]
MKRNRQEGSQRINEREDIIRQRRKKKGKKKKESHRTGGSHAIVKVFWGFLMQRIIDNLIKKRQNPEGMTLTKKAGRSLTCFAFFVFTRIVPKYQSAEEEEYQRCKGPEYQSQGSC